MLVGTYISIILTFAIESQVPHKPNVLLSWKYESGILSRIFFFLFLQYICFRKGHNSPLCFGGVAFYLPMFDSFADFFSFFILQRYPSCWFSVYCTYLGQSIAVLFLYVL